MQGSLPVVFTPGSSAPEWGPAREGVRCRAGHGTLLLAAPRCHVAQSLALARSQKLGPSLQMPLFEAFPKCPLLNCTLQPCCCTEPWNPLTCLFFSVITSCLSLCISKKGMLLVATLKCSGITRVINLLLFDIIDRH